MADNLVKLKLTLTKHSITLVLLSSTIYMHYIPGFMFLVNKTKLCVLVFDFQVILRIMQPVFGKVKLITIAEKKT